MYNILILISLVFTVIGKTIPYREFDNNYIHNEKSIPKIIFRTSDFSYDTLPQEIENVLSHFTNMHPEYTQVYFDNYDRINFITLFYPEYIQTYMSIVPEAFQADLFRYLVLYKYGGVYNDIGHIYMRNINEMIYEDDEFVTSRDFYPHQHCYIYNAFIAVYPKHPILKAIIDLVIKNVNNKYYGGNPLEPTSPGACGHAFNNFFNNPITQNIDSGFYIINNFKIRMYEYPGDYIRNGTIAYIKTKFDGYYELMYTKQKKIRYSDLWNQRKIYR